MNKMTKLKSTALIAIMLILSPTMVMAERHDHSNNHVSNQRAYQARYNNNSHDKYDRHHNEYRHYNKHNRHDEYRHYNKHHRHYDKHAYKHWRREHRHHHHDYQPAGILLGIQNGNFSFLLRD
ncbi:hypothetical protein AU255_14570 [Methyloprofundus sedimenti]|uniref:Uncharacterized protein n=1 Tax=Methyloprofundus sedimenti TaxID=1420851 RepID=A0A1V8M424_9GAMM|nr:hypothetical protein AU255_14570 [Methyloprofundus sedimenti]